MIFHSGTISGNMTVQRVPFPGSLKNCNHPALVQILMVQHFKRNAVLLCAEPGRLVVEVVENLGIGKRFSLNDNLFLNFFR